MRDIKVRRFAQMPANRKNPGVHHTARQSRDREGALAADSVAGMRSLTVAARIGASRPSTFMSRTRRQVVPEHGGHGMLYVVGSLDLLLGEDSVDLCLSWLCRAA